jgi:hypothetical protein
MKSLSPRVRILLIAGLALAVLFGGVVAWVMLPPRALSCAGGHPVSLAAYKDPSPVGVPLELRAGDVIARGRYLTQAADCEVCHTREGGQPFAGGRAFKSPFGVLYSPNITGDRATGIGTWSDADFLRAVHQGIAKNGERLYPAFPYESYTLITDDDVLAIKAYLLSLPPVRCSTTRMKDFSLTRIAARSGTAGPIWSKPWGTAATVIPRAILLKRPITGTSSAAQ